MSTETQQIVTRNIEEDIKMIRRRYSVVLTNDALIKEKTVRM